ncbi:hypothetical protein [Candidatus Spongiihabitans sp.]|uniref:hypothetical protein n=1 Tax=Candidatus Spongiihabitans sp. TaxID=3101308 RepID=UPI003C7C8712
MKYNLTGSEDEEFFRRAGMKGAKMIRNRCAYVYPRGIEKKATLKWIVVGTYCRFTQRAYIARQYKTKSVPTILLQALASLIGGVILLPFCPFHKRIRIKTLRLLIKPVAYIRGLFGPTDVKLYAHIGEGEGDENWT